MGELCPLQEKHIEELGSLGARMENIEKKIDVVDKIDKNLEVITALFKNQQEVNAKQEKTNEKLETAIEKVATAVTQSKLDGSISFNQIFSKLFLVLIGGGAIYIIYQIANGLLK